MDTRNTRWLRVPPPPTFSIQVWVTEKCDHHEGMGLDANGFQDTCGEGNKSITNPWLKNVTLLRMDGGHRSGGGHGRWLNVECFGETYKWLFCLVNSQNKSPKSFQKSCGSHTWEKVGHLSLTRPLKVSISHSMHLISGGMLSTRYPGDPSSGFHGRFFWCKQITQVETV